MPIFTFAPVSVACHAEAFEAATPCEIAPSSNARFGLVTELTPALQASDANEDFGTTAVAAPDTDASTRPPALADRSYELCRRSVQRDLDASHATRRRALQARVETRDLRRDDRRPSQPR